MTAPDSLTIALAEFGISHEPCGDGRRFLSHGEHSIGVADATQGWRLVGMLHEIKHAGFRDGMDAAAKALDTVVAATDAAIAKVAAQ